MGEDWTHAAIVAINCNFDVLTNREITAGKVNIYPMTRARFPKSQVPTWKRRRIGKKMQIIRSSLLTIPDTISSLESERYRLRTSLETWHSAEVLTSR